MSVCSCARQMSTALRNVDDMREKKRDSLYSSVRSHTSVSVCSQNSDIALVKFAALGWFHYWNPIVYWIVNLALIYNIRITAENCLSDGLRSQNTQFEIECTIFFWTDKKKLTSKKRCTHYNLTLLKWFGWYEGKTEWIDVKLLIFSWNGLTQFRVGA